MFNRNGAAFWIPAIFWFLSALGLAGLATDRTEQSTSAAETTGFTACGGTLTTPDG